MRHVHPRGKSAKDRPVTSDHDQPPASGEPPPARLRPRTADPTADEVASGPGRTAADAGEGRRRKRRDHGTPPAEASSDTSADHDTAAALFVRHLRGPTRPRPTAAAPGLAAVRRVHARRRRRRRRHCPGRARHHGTAHQPRQRRERARGPARRSRARSARPREPAPAAGVDGRALDDVAGRVDTLEAAVATSRPAAGDPASPTASPPSTAR